MFSNNRMNTIKFNNFNMWNTVSRRQSQAFEKRRLPITSYGIILFTFNEYKVPKYLIVQRRDTIEYVDFVRGQYSYNDLKLYLSRMTDDERWRIKNFNFDQLWEDLWINKEHRIYKKCYVKAKQKFEQIYDNLESILDETKSTVNEPQWVFPKGKKNIRENAIECARREFLEETRMSLDETKLFFDKPFIERFKGSNGKSYSTHFYVTYSEKEMQKKLIETNALRKNKLTISEEISDILWLDLCEIKNKINERRYNILVNIDKKIRERTFEC